MRIGTGTKVSVFTCAMLLILALLVVTFGQFRFSSQNTYHAEFSSVSKLKTGQDVRIAGIPAGKVDSIAIDGDHVNVTFSLDKRYQLYTSTRAAIRYANLIGDRYLEILAGPGDLSQIRPGATIPRANTKPALDLDALLGGLRPVLKGLDADKVNQVSNAVIELLQGNGGALADVLSSTGAFTQTLAARDQLIGDVINDLNSVLATVDSKNSELNASIDQLQQLVSELNRGREPIAEAIPPLASAEGDLTQLLSTSRRPLQGVIENARPLATVLDDRKAEVNQTIEPLAENYLRLTGLGSYGAFFNIYFCALKLKVNGPAGSDILIPTFAPADATKGRCAFAK
ncbi:MCE family protein [Mycolicibacterium fluoranthenivorans]|uniref:MCE family protein n=1 Tax=Mycolicibacterium fluoranthenivorans TaxID=258505 RepID=A0A7G8P6W9_9MYCO|nr:MlaD family protein [Mycolicibacterium fluoranthenivorans]QNJ90085.1 MCE family protein [Mycolicibacterium fluoranthenivorans]